MNIFRLKLDCRQYVGVPDPFQCAEKRWVMYPDGSYRDSTLAPFTTKVCIALRDVIFYRLIGMKIAVNIRSKGFSGVDRSILIERNTDQ